MIFADDNQAHIYIEEGLLKLLEDAMTSNSAVFRKDAFWMISNLVCVDEQIIGILMTNKFMITNLLGAFAGKNISVRVEALQGVYNMIKCCNRWGKGEYISELVFKFGIFFHIVDKVLILTEACSIL